MKIMRFSALFLAFFLANSAIYAERVISPCEGSFSNRQMLVLNTEDGAECFYSLSGSDPLVSGFAYDEPVLLDVAGKVRVRIACVAPGKNAEYYDISYNVQERLPAEISARDFILNLQKQNIVEIKSGKEMSIPDNFLTGAGSSSNNPRNRAKVLKIESENSLSRFVPFSVSDSVNIWRFTAFVSAKSSEQNVKNQKKFPFSFENWKLLLFSDDDFEWRVDGEEWKSGRGSKVIDRKSEHILEWKRKSEEENIEKFTIPKKPKILASRLPSGAVSFCADDDGWNILPVSSGLDNEKSHFLQPCEKIIFDVLPGEFVSSKAKFSLFFDGVLMGESSCNWGIDREPPLPPVLTPNIEGSFSRSSVLLSITTEENARSFYTVSDGDSVSKLKKYTSPILLSASGEKISKYFVRAFSRDAYGNESLPSEFSVTIDELNYPVRSFAEISAVLKTKHHAHFSLENDIVLPSGESVIDSDCMISSSRGAKIIVPSDGFLTIKGTWISLESCVFVKESGNSAESRFIVIDDSNVSFLDSEVCADFLRFGTALDIKKSVLTLENTGISVSSGEYACAVNAADSFVTSDKCRIWASGASAVVFNSVGGLLSVLESDCTISPSSAKTSRIAFLSDVSVRLSKNNFHSSFFEPLLVSPIWKDEKTIIYENFSNVSTGFLNN